MRIRSEQLTQLGAAKLGNFRREKFLELGNRGFQVTQGSESGSFFITDAAGGSAQVLSRGYSVSLTTGEARTFQTEQYSYGKIKYITDPVGNRAYFERDDNGLLTAIDCGHGRLHRFTHEPSGKLLGIQYPDGTETRSDYNALGSACCGH